MSNQPTHQQALAKIRELIKDIQFAMFTTLTANDELHSRPMATQQLEFDGDLYFLTREHSHKTGEMVQHPRVNLAYSDPQNHKYVSIAGRAEVFRDQKKIDELWNPMYKAWFPNGKEDPEIGVIRVRVESAEYWHAPEGKMVQVLGFAKAAITGEKYRPGENVAVNLKQDPAA